MAANGTLVIRFIGDLKEFERATGSLSKKMTSVGRGLTRNVTLPLVGVGIAATKQAMDFEKSMSLIKGLVGASDKQIRQYSKTILTEGPKWGKPPQELADALYYVTSSGFQGAKALNILKMSAKASTAGLGTTSDVANLLTSAMNAYRKSGLGAAQATDILAKAVKLGKLEPADLAQVMGQVLPVAAAMGVKFNEVSAALASMSMSGTDASEGTTQLRGILSALLKPSVEANKQLARMGLSAAGLRQELKTKGLLATLTTLQTRFKGNTAATAAVFGNVRALTGVMNMMGEKTDQTKSIFREMTNATGSLNAGFKAAQQTAQYKFDVAMDQIKTSMIVLGQDLLPLVAQALGRITVWIQKGTKAWQGLNEHTRRLILTIAGIVAAVGPFLLVFGKILFIVSKLTPQIRLVMLVIGALVAIFKVAKDHSSSLGQALQKVVSIFTTGKFAAGVALVRATFAKFVAYILPTLKQVGSQIASALVPLFREIANLVTSVVIPAFVKIMPIVGPVLRFLVKMIGGAIVGAIKGAAQFIHGFVQVISGVFGLISALIHGQWSKAWHSLLTIVKGVWNLIVGGLKVWFNVGILGIFKHGLLSLLKGWKGLWTKLGDLAKNAWKWLEGLFRRGTGWVTRIIVNAIKGYVRFWRNLFSDLWGIVRNGWKVLRSAFGGATRAIRTVIHDAISYVVGRFRGGFSNLRGIVSKGWDILRGIFARLVNFVRHTIPDAFSRAIRGIGSIWGKLQGLARKPVAFIVNTVYMDGIRRVVNALPGVPDLPKVHFAAGGAVRGGVPGKDSVPALMMPGEHVWTAKEVTQVGGQKAMLALRALIREGGLKALAGLGVPAFANGGFLGATGGGGLGIIGHLLSKGGNVVKGLLGKLPFGHWSAALHNLGGWGPMLGQMVGHIAGAVKDWVASKARGLVDRLMGGFHGKLPGPAGGGVGRWAPTILQALAMLGQPASLLGAVERRMMQESGGNPRAINLWDSNAMRGTPSIGLMQVIGPTFSAYAGRFRGLGIYNPLANVYAGLNYALHRYGNIAGPMLQAGGYDTGGILPSGRLAYNRSGKPERVLDPTTTRNFALLTAALDQIMRGHVGSVVATRPWAASGLVNPPAGGGTTGAAAGAAVVVHQHFPTSADPKAAARASADRLVARLAT